MLKDGCNNMEKNKILRYHDQGHDVERIAKELRLTERIVRSIVGHYRPDAEVAEAAPKPTKKKAKKKKAKKKSAKDDFDD